MAKKAARWSSAMVKIHFTSTQTPLSYSTHSNPFLEKDAKDAKAIKRIIELSMFRLENYWLIKKTQCFELVCCCCLRWDMIFIWLWYNKCDNKLCAFCCWWRTPANILSLAHCACRMQKFQRQNTQRHTKFACFLLKRLQWIPYLVAMVQKSWQKNATLRKNNKVLPRKHMVVCQQGSNRSLSTVPRTVVPTVGQE